MDLDRLMSSTEDEHLAELSESSEPAAWDPPTSVTLVPEDPAATASPAVERLVHPEPVPAGATEPGVPLWEVAAAAFVGGALGAFAGGFALGLTLAWALGL